MEQAGAPLRVRVETATEEAAAERGVRAVRVLNVFDFDGTLFRSPNPSPTLWDAALLGVIKAAPAEKGLGWFQDERSLLPPLVPQHVSALSPLFVPHVHAAVCASAVSPSALTVLLTGRNVRFTARITQLLHEGGLVFDHYGFKPLDSATQHVATLDFKLDYIANLVRAHPTLQRVCVWEDRPKHAQRLEHDLSTRIAAHCAVSVTLVKADDLALDVAAEVALVHALRDTHLPSLTWLHRIAYSAAVLDDAAQQLLRGLFPAPPTWTSHCHHVTLCLGPLSVLHSNRPSLTPLVPGAPLMVHVDAVAQTERVWALRVVGVPSLNAVPHVTLSCAPGVKPHESNLLAPDAWRPLTAPEATALTALHATVTELARYTPEATPTAASTAPPSRRGTTPLAATLAAVPVATLLKTHTTRRGAALGEAVQQVKAWLREGEGRALAVTSVDAEERTRAVIAYIRDHVEHTPPTRAHEDTEEEKEGEGEGEKEEKGTSAEDDAGSEAKTRS